MWAFYVEGTGVGLLPFSINTQGTFASCHTLQ